MKTYHHNIASRTIFYAVCEGSYRSNLVHMDVGSAEHPGLHDLHSSEQVSNCITPPRYGKEKKRKVYASQVQLRALRK
eukprot:1151452-Pelagomonas_calceolata.AAC.1